MNPTSDTDWDTVTVIRKRAPKASELRSASAVNDALRTGQAVDTEKKFTAASNRQHQATKNTARLDQETEELKHQLVSLDTAKAIQQARAAKEWTQKDLATRINEKQTVVNEYEAGKAVPNQQIITKLERALGVKLSGKHIGEPLAPKKKGAGDQGAAGTSKSKGKK